MATRPRRHPGDRRGGGPYPNPNMHQPPNTENKNEEQNKTKDGTREMQIDGADVRKNESTAPPAYDEGPSQS